MDRPPVLRGEGLRVERRGRVILRDVSVTVRDGMKVLIQGPSGAGKTTLFRVLGLLEPPTAGRVVVNGTDATGLAERHRARLRREVVGIVFQDFQLVPDLTAIENAQLPQEHANTRDQPWLDTLFDRLGLTDRKNEYPATLSGGERQRVAIARALANRPDVVLADEPTGQLDPETAEDVLELLLELQTTTGTALVVVSHDRTIADRFETTIKLRGGRVEA